MNRRDRLAYTAPMGAASNTAAGDDAARSVAAARFRRAVDDDDSFCVQAVRLARVLFDVPVGFVSVFDRGRERLVARRGVILREVSAQNPQFGAGTTAGEVDVIEDLEADPRGVALALRYALPDSAFFASAPLVVPGAGAVGCLSILDDRPRSFGVAEQTRLRELAALVVAGVDTRQERGLSPDVAILDLPDLLQSESYLLHTLMDHLPDNIYFKDTQSRFVRVNRSMAQYIGLSHPEDLVGKTDYDAFAEAHARTAYEDEQRIIETGEPLIDKEEQETWPDGHATWVSTTKLPLRDGDDRVIGTFGLSRDVTDRKLAQEAMMRHAVELEAVNAQHRVDMALASELQRAFLPERYPVFPPGADPDDSLLRFTHVYMPMEVVGGDFFTVVPLSDTSAGVLLCDVVGHGVRAALVTSMMNAVVTELKDTASDPAVFLRKVNERLWASLGGRFGYGFVTAFYLVAEAGDPRIRFAVAGHPSPLLARRAAGRVDPLVDAPGMSGQALLLQEKSEYHTHEVTAEPGDALLLFTDGVYEVRGPGRETYGVERLAALVARHVDEPMPALVQRLLSEVLSYSADHQFQDDVCLLGMEFAEHPRPIQERPPT